MWQIDAVARDAKKEGSSGNELGVMYSFHAFLKYEPIAQYKSILFRKDGLKVWQRCIG